MPLAKRYWRPRGKALVPSCRTTSRLRRSCPTHLRRRCSSLSSDDVVVSSSSPHPAAIGAQTTSAMSTGIAYQRCPCMLHSLSAGTREVAGIPTILPLPNTGRSPRLTGDKPLSTQTGCFLEASLPDTVPATGARRSCPVLVQSGSAPIAALPCIRLKTPQRAVRDATVNSDETKTPLAGTVCWRLRGLSSPGGAQGSRLSRSPLGSDAWRPSCRSPGQRGLTSSSVSALRSMGSHSSPKERFVAARRQMRLARRSTPWTGDRQLSRRAGRYSGSGSSR